MSTLNPAHEHSPVVVVDSSQALHYEHSTNSKPDITTDDTNHLVAKTHKKSMLQGSENAAMITSIRQT